MVKSAAIDLSDIRRLAITAMFSDDVLYDRLVLKGGNALAIALNMSKRSSIDLDFSVSDDFDDVQELQKRISEALANRFGTAGYVVFDFKLQPKPNAPREDQSKRWGGYQVTFKVMERSRFESLQGDLDAVRRESIVIGPNQRRIFTIDISKYEYTEGKIEVELDDYTVYVYTPTMIAIEKLRAICQQMPEYKLQRSPSPRARDFFDIHEILSSRKIDLTLVENLDLTRHIFAAKEVPLRLMGNISEQREFHRPDWDSVRLQTSGSLAEFDFYFGFVVKLVNSMQPLWNKDTPL